MTYDGYGEARQFVQPAGRIVDFGVDADGTVFVLVQQARAYRVHRFSPAGTEEGSWEPQGVQGLPRRCHGRCARRSCLAARPAAHVDVRPRRARDVELGRSASGCRLTWRCSPTAACLSARPDRNAIEILDHDGQLQAEWGEFEGGPGRFHEPVSVTANPQGDLLVIETDGQALLFHNPPGAFEPQFVRSFPIAFRGLPLSPHGVAFDGGARILLPEVDSGTLVYGLDGQRLMADVPERDLNTRGFGFVVRYQATAERLYVLDEAHRLWVMDR